MARTRRKPDAAAKTAWKSLHDRGPHTATLPSGMEVTFVIPDSNALIRADMLPDRLAELAVVTAAYPDGVTGYLGDLSLRAMASPDQSVKLKDAVRLGIELRDWLLAEMLLEPKVTAAEVASGEFPPADLEMLIELGERRRNTDAKGVKLPIVVLEELATFRHVGDGGAAAVSGDSREAAAAASA